MTTPTNEQWRPVPGASKYEVSNRGAIRTLRHVDAETGEPLRMRLALSNGYLTTKIAFDDAVSRTVFAHRVVAAAFLGPRPPGCQVLHTDDVKTNNVLGNLRYGTKSENLRDSYRNGRRKRPTHRKRLTVAQVRAIRARVDSGETVAVIAKALGLPEWLVYGVATGRHYRDVLATAALQAWAALAEQQADAAREAQRAVATVEGIERVCPPEGQRRKRVAPHSPPASSPRSRSTT